MTWEKSFSMTPPFMLKMLNFGQGGCLLLSLIHLQLCIFAYITVSSNALQDKKWERFACPLINTRKLTATSACYTPKQTLKENVSTKTKTELNKTASEKWMDEGA